MTCPRSLVESRLLAMAGRAMWRQSFSSLSRWAASQTVAAWSEKPGCPGEQGGWEGFGPYRDGAQGQCLPVGVGPDGDPVVE